MIDVRAKLAELGWTLPIAATPVAAYVPAIQTGNLVFTAGQLPIVEGKIVAIGKVGKDVSVHDAKKLAQICALNCLAAVQTVVEVNTIAKIVRVVGYINGMPGFVNQPDVVNSASELFLYIWGEAGKHARSSIGVSELPLSSPLEIELTVEIN